MAKTDLRRMLMSGLLVAAFALAGCAGDDDTSSGDAMTTTTTTSTTASATGTTTTTTTTAPAAPAPRHDNVTLGNSVADCSVVGPAVAGGAPADPPNGVVSIDLTSADWNRTFSYEITDPGQTGQLPANPLASLCIGFDSIGDLGNSATSIPAGAATLYIGADGLPGATIHITIV